MTCSDLAYYWDGSPNRYYGRAYDVRKITPHHMAGALSIEGCASVFDNPNRQASSNYGIGGDGRIACYVDEDDAAWTSSSWENDNQAITIEVANTPEGVRNETWEVSDEAWDALVRLCVDICQRYGFRLDYTGGPDGSLTEHRMFAATGCPGPYLHARMGELADTVNAILDGEEPYVEPVQEPGTPVNDAGLWYRTHCQNIGWCDPVRDGQTAGTVGFGMRWEALKCRPPKGWAFEISEHVQNIGWRTWVCDGDAPSSGEGTSDGDPIMGTVGQSKRIEAFMARVIKRPAGDKRKLYYRVHQQDVGWKAWTPENYATGTDGMGIRLEALQMKLQ